MSVNESREILVPVRGCLLRNILIAESLFCFLKFCTSCLCLSVDFPSVRLNINSVSNKSYRQMQLILPFFEICKMAALHLINALEKYKKI